MTTYQITATPAAIGAMITGLATLMDRAIATGARTADAPNEIDAAVAQIFGGRSKGSTRASEYADAKVDYISAHNVLWQLHGEDRSGDAEASWNRGVAMELNLDRTITDGEVR